MFINPFNSLNHYATHIADYAPTVNGFEYALRRIGLYIAFYAYKGFIIRNIQ